LHTITGAGAGVIVEDTTVTAELIFENTVLGLQIVWIEDGLIDYYDVQPIGETPLPATARFVPTSTDEFTTFRLFFRNNPTLRFVVENGDVVGLVVSSVNGETMAMRID
jgi:hypothetical protein